MLLCPLYSRTPPGLLISSVTLNPLLTSCSNYLLQLPLVYAYGLLFSSVIIIQLLTSCSIYLLQLPLVYA